MSVNLTKIGVYFDGSYFSGLSAYYLHHHDRRSRISLAGIRKYVTRRVAHEECVDTRHCRIVDSHLFAGRISAFDAREKESDVLFRDRLWDEILQKEDVTAHYLPMGMRGEKGIDVSLALECYEAVVTKGLDVVVLVTGDGDFVPLVRKLNARGVRVLLLGWTYAFVDGSGRSRGATVSRALMSEATYSVQMDEFIDSYDTLPETERVEVDELFRRRRTEQEDVVAVEAEPEPMEVAVAVGERGPVRSVRTPVRAASSAPQPVLVPAGPPASRASLERFAQQGFAQGFSVVKPAPAQPAPVISEDRVTGRVSRVLAGYGFIKSDWGDANLFFHYSAVEGKEFDHMQPGTPVSFVETKGDRGMVAKSIKVIEAA